MTRPLHISSAPKQFVQVTRPDYCAASGFSSVSSPPWHLGRGRRCPRRVVVPTLKKQAQRTPGARSEALRLLSCASAALGGEGPGSLGAGRPFQGFMDTGGGQPRGGQGSGLPRCDPASFLLARGPTRL